MPLPRPAPGTAKWWVVGAVGIALGVAMSIYWGLHATVGLPTWQTVSYKVIDDRSVRVDFEVTNPGGTALTCTVQALAQDFSTVGTVRVAVPASGNERSEHRVTLRTTSRAVTGEVRTCE
ncbi:DUF4307 domain-containing protein [Terracoccus luteus]|uniref:DUF4307 domain-containing protein n=1 Tax=Terracoccus luteus TaxID=53356 RepID=A0A839PN28_9MICO|nr:DUF4307 domain-containing protein [Terracoccus luteus]MBB2985630.1 hypothetical protein [Terracoccus luteus]MCP2171282.1 hypothetical protein [Terracoccus luteus]